MRDAIHWAGHIDFTKFDTTFLGAGMTCFGGYVPNPKLLRYPQTTTNIQQHAPPN